MFSLARRHCSIYYGQSVQPKRRIHSDGVDKYSVSYDLIGEKVDVRLTKHVVEVFFKGARVASHVRAATQQRDPIVKPEHMPEAHRKYLSYAAEECQLVTANYVFP